MIEKKSEPMPILTTSSDMSFDMKEFFNHLNKKKKEKHILLEMSMNAGILSFYPELYSKNKSSSGKDDSAGIDKNMQRRAVEVISELTSKANTSQIHNALVSEINEHIKLADKHVSEQDSSGSEFLDIVAHFDDKETKELLSGTIKAHPMPVQLRQDISSLQTDPQRPATGMHSAQSAIAERLHQANTSTSSDNITSAKQTLNFDYPFLRWSGAHSVQVRVSSDARRTGNLKLQPSDSRAADMLTRKIGYLDGYAAEVLSPQHDDDESERRNLSEGWEDDLE